MSDLIDDDLADDWCTDYHCAGDCGLRGHGYQHAGNGMKDIILKLKDLRERFIFQGGSQFANKLADELTSLREANERLLKDSERYKWVLAQLANMKRADFFEPLRQHFYDIDEKYPDVDDVTAAIDAAIGAAKERT